MAALITSLLDKTDNFELIRDQIASILVLELTNQQTLAVDADPAQDPLLYSANVYTERAIPFEQYLNEPSAANAIPIINVWFDSSSYNRDASNSFERQQSISIFNIDCYGYGQATETAEGHEPGDKLAAKEAQRIFRLVRNILMSAPYIKLGMLGIVGDKWPQSVTQFQPQFAGESLGRVVGVRLSLEVKFNEFSPENTPCPLEYVSIDVTQASDGRILLTADYDYTA